METEQKVFTSVGEALTDFNRRILELENDMEEMDVAMEVIYSLFFSLGVKPSSIPDLADHIREQHKKAREELKKVAEEARAKAEEVEHPVDGQQPAHV